MQMTAGFKMRTARKRVYSYPLGGGVRAHLHLGKLHLPFLGKVLYWNSNKKTLEMDLILH